jgi:hypothetical protein
LPVVDDLLTTKVPLVSTRRVPVTVTLLVASFAVRSVPAVTVRLLVIFTESKNVYVVAALTTML